ncbi:MAG: hypothetical protein LLF95_02505 [Bacteroidales bacterium]|nr:hypothetical protein [Bacteroidales bacterium]
MRLKTEINIKKHPIILNSTPYKISIKFNPGEYGGKKKIVDSLWKPVERAWTSDKLAQFKQLNIFQNADEKQFEVVKRLPYKFSFIYEDEEGKRSKTMI